MNRAMLSSYLLSVVENLKRQPGFAAISLRMLFYKIYLPIILNIAGPAVYAAEAVDESLSDAEIAAAASREGIEEIEIRGQRSLTGMRLKLQESEVRMYDLYNTLNRNNMNDVACTKSTRPEGRTLIRRCEPGFIQQARAEDMQRLLYEGFYPRSDSHLKMDYKNQFDRLDAEMKELGEKYPDLAQAMTEYQQQSDALRRSQRNRGWLSRLIGYDEEE